jgi:transposase InsO family protein
MPWQKSTLPAVRAQLVRAVLAGREPVAQVCRRFGVSRQTAYKFTTRFLREGLAGLTDRRRGPRPRRDPRWARWRRAVLAQRRRRPTWGARKLRWWLRQRQPHGPLPAARTVQRWLAAAGVVAPRRRPRKSGAPARPRWRAARRPNDVWTMDLKGWFRTGDGQRVEPLTVRDLASRYLLAVQPLRRRSEAAVRAVCQRLFARYGQPRAIRTDLGAPFCGNGPHGLTALSLWWHRLGVRVEFARAHQNNAHEQMHRVLKAETARPPARRWTAQCQRLRRWRRHYNEARPHESFGLRVPAAVYRAGRHARGRLRAPAYPRTWVVRLVGTRGEVRLAGRARQIGRAFAGLPVGFQPCPVGYAVYFGPLHLGRIELRRGPHLQPAPGRQT